MTTKRISASQRQALEDIERYGDPWARVVGQSQHGGWYRVMLVIVHRRMWARYDGRRKRWVLTAEGRRALKDSE